MKRQVKLVDINSYSHLQGASCIEDVLCAAVLLSQGEIAMENVMEDAKNWHEKMTGEDCYNCVYHTKCLASIINE